MSQVNKSEARKILVQVHKISIYYVFFAIAFSGLMYLRAIVLLKRMPSTGDEAQDLGGEGFVHLLSGMLMSVPFVALASILLYLIILLRRLSVYSVFFLILTALTYLGVVYFFFFDHLGLVSFIAG